MCTCSVIQCVLHLLENFQTYFNSLTSYEDPLTLKVYSGKLSTNSYNYIQVMQVIEDPLTLKVYSGKLSYNSLKSCISIYSFPVSVGCISDSSC